ncbi:MAG: hypothetical protein J6W96_01385 [Alphaproteobacteria bacterium]|nr:hypothetical protein [Alphaproteobacteria bacterium]
MKKWVENIKSKLEKFNIDLKQLVLGIIILLTAILLLSLSFCNKQEKIQESNKILSKEINTTFNQKAVASEKNILKEDSVEAAIEKVKKIEDSMDKVVISFITTTEKNFNYKVYYTEDNESEFDEEHSVTYPGQAGMNKYSIILPVKKIARFRLNFSDKAGKVTIRDIYMAGSQKADLSDFTKYEFYQVENVSLNADNSLSFVSNTTDPALLYTSSLLEE